MWSGNRRSLGTFLHSPMLDELKSLEAMLMQRVTHSQSQQGLTHTPVQSQRSHRPVFSSALPSSCSKVPCDFGAGAALMRPEWICRCSKALWGNRISSSAGSDTGRHPHAPARPSMVLPNRLLCPTCPSCPAQWAAAMCGHGQVMGGTETPPQRTVSVRLSDNIGEL